MTKYLRDEKSGAAVSSDRDGRDAYRLEKARNKKIKSLEKEIEHLRNNLESINIKMNEILLKMGQNG